MFVNGLSDSYVLFRLCRLSSSLVCFCSVELFDIGEESFEEVWELRFADPPKEEEAPDCV